MTVQDIVEEVLGEVGLLLFFGVEELHRRLELWRDGVLDVLFELCFEQVCDVVNWVGPPEIIVEEIRDHQDHGSS